MLEECHNYLGLSNVYLLAVTAGCGSGHSAKHDRQNWLPPTVAFQYTIPVVQHEAAAEVSRIGYL